MAERETACASDASTRPSRPLRQFVSERESATDSHSSETVKYTLAWAVCPACGESWTSDIDPDETWVIREVVDECRAHMTATEHAPTFDVGIEP